MSSSAHSLSPILSRSREREQTLSPNQPIGVFDSGIGGLTVVRALMERLPYENIVYFGDTARVPYGVKSVETITHFTTQIAQFLLEKDVKLLVIACNTMAAVAAQVVKDLSTVPVLDVIDAGAASARGGKRVGVIGTPTTINSNAYARAIHDYAPDSRIYSQACAAVRAAGGRRLARSRSHPADRTGLPETPAWPNTSTPWCSAVPITRC